MYTRCEGEAMTKIVRKWITLCCLESSLQEQLHTGSCQHLGSNPDLFRSAKITRGQFNTLHYDSVPDPV